MGSTSAINQRTAAEITKHPDLLNSTLQRTSRYVSGGLTEVNANGNALEWWERAIFPKDNANDVLYAVDDKFVGNLRLISKLFYDTDIYWWVIAQYNDILDPYGEVVQGIVIRIPTKEAVEQIMQGRLGGIASKREVPTTRILPIV